jgi:hypothetical protein
MDKWPQEIYEHVVSFLEERVRVADVPVLPAVAAVSRSFQYAVERRTFKQLHKHLTDTELDKLQQILTPRRRHILRSLSAGIVLPSYPPELYSEFETNEDRQANNASATATLRRLFEIIASWDADTPHDQVTPSLCLIIHWVSSLSDERTSYRRSYPDMLPSGVRPDILDLRYRFSMVNMTCNGADLPTLPRVREFKFENGPRCWSPAVPALLTSKMPNVQSVDWNLDYAMSYGGWALYYSLEKMYRDDFVTGVRSIKLPKSTKRFSYVSPDLKIGHGVLGIPSSIELGTADESIGLALRELTKDCTTISLLGCVGVSVFEASIDTRRGNDELCWQNVTDLHVSVPVRCPDGTWLFDVEGEETPGADETEDILAALQRLPPGYGATDEEREEAVEYFEDNQDVLLQDYQDGHQFRSTPNDDEMNVFLTAFARRCSLMPALQLAMFEVQYNNPEYWPLQVSCVAPGKSFREWDTEYADGVDTWRVYIHANEWRPAKATLDAFRAIGKNRDGRKPTICFLPWGVFDM